MKADAAENLADAQSTVHMWLETQGGDTSDQTIE